MGSFVSVDFETANEQRGSACSVALVKFDEQGNGVERFSTLLHPHSSLDYFSSINTMVHGITAGDVLEAPTWGDIHERVVELIGDLPIVAHNMAFDGYVLTDLDRLYEKESLMNRRYCTVRLARKLFPGMESRGLTEVFTHYFPGESFDHHQALDDAWACGRIFAQMQHELGIKELSRLCPPTGPGAVRQKRLRYRTEQPNCATVSVEASGLLERYKNSGVLCGHNVTFTGALEVASRTVLAQLVTELGGITGKGVTKKTTILVVGASNPAAWAKGASGSRKLSKATALRESGSPITVMSENDFLDFLDGGQGRPEAGV